MPDNGLLDEPIKPSHVTADRRDEEAHQHDIGDPANDERWEMRTEAACIAEIAEQPADRQHAHQRDNTDDADRNVALRDWQRVGFAGFTRTRGSHRTGRPLATGFTNFSSVQIAETPIAPAPTKRTFVLHVFCASAAAAVVISPAISEKCGTPQPQPITVPINIAIPTERPTKWPIANSANERAKS